MADLKKCFESLGYADVKTYLNSGNVIFSSVEESIANITERIEKMIKNKFQIDIPTFTLLQENLVDILHRAPTWWGTENKEIYDNLIFVMSPLTFDDVYKEIGEPKPELEKIQEYKSAIFWSFSRKDYRKTNWWSKTITTQVASKLTIRTANMVQKIVDM